MTTAPETEALYDVADAIARVITDTPATPSELARRAKIASAASVYPALRWMARHDYIISVGNGARARFRARRAGEYNNPR